jgi:hypothetical protein
MEKYFSNFFLAYSLRQTQTLAGMEYLLLHQLAFPVYNSSHQSVLHKKILFIAKININIFIKKLPTLD